MEWKRRKKNARTNHSLPSLTILEISGLFTVIRPYMGAVFWYRKSDGPVRCGFEKAEILRWGSVRFSDIVNPTARCGAVLWYIIRCGSARLCKNGYPTVRFGAVIYPTVRFCAVFRIRECYGAVRCGFQMSWNLRCGSVIFYVLRCGSVRFGFEEGKNPTVNRTEPIGKTAPNR